jgi:hypothetical protein
VVDGYTVEEAASVLGVPRERVWELLARGVISGSTDMGGVMRVRLKVDQPLDPPIPAPERPQEPSATDLTPFRELLTEFRSLTERYGQALLALGEARGEVATLRSRVELLEARVDVRLPPAEPIRTSWDPGPAAPPAEVAAESEASTAADVTDVAYAPPPEEQVREPDADAAEELPVDAAPDDVPADAAAVVDTHRGAGDETPPLAGVVVDDVDETDEDDAAPARRPRDRRRATEQFADALARADDPSPPELPGAAETAAALAALRERPAVATSPIEPAAHPEADVEDQPNADPALPREVASADAVPVADEVATEALTSDEPRAADPIASVAPEDVTERPDPVIEGAGGVPERPPHDGARDFDAAPTISAEDDREPDSAADALDVPHADEPPRVEPIAAATAGAPEPRRDEGDPTWDPDVYSAEFGDPGWMSADDVAAAAPEGGQPPAEPDRAEPSPAAPANTGTEREAEPAPQADQPQRGALDEPAWPWGAERPSDEEDWPRSRQLDEGLAALDALSHPEEAPRSSDDPPSPPPRPAWTPRVEPSTPTARPTPTWTRSTPPPPLGVRSPASRAYRRLRRIFPT